MTWLEISYHFQWYFKTDNVRPKSKSENIALCSWHQAVPDERNKLESRILSPSCITKIIWTENNSAPDKYDHQFVHPMDNQSVLTLQKNVCYHSNLQCFCKFWRDKITNDKYANVSTLSTDTTHPIWTKNRIATNHTMEMMV